MSRRKALALAIIFSIVYFLGWGGLIFWIGFELVSEHLYVVLNGVMFVLYVLGSLCFGLLVAHFAPKEFILVFSIIVAVAVGSYLSLIASVSFSYVEYIWLFIIQIIGILYSCFTIILVAKFFSERISQRKILETESIEV